MKRERSLWWWVAGWALTSLALANLHIWAGHNRQVAKVLLFWYGTIVWGYATWKAMGWLDREMAARKERKERASLPPPSS